MERDRSESREHGRPLRYNKSQGQHSSSRDSSRGATPPRTPLQSTPANHSEPSTPNAWNHGPSMRSTPHGHIQTAMPSPHGSGTSSARGRRPGSSMVANGPLRYVQCIGLAMPCTSAWSIIAHVTGAGTSLVENLTVTAYISHVLAPRCFLSILPPVANA